MPHHHVLTPRSLARTVMAALVMLVLVLPGARLTAAAAQADTDFDTWDAVAQQIATELDGAVTSYQGGDTSGAASQVQRAYNSGYVASNMQVVTVAFVGQDTADARKQSFSALRQAIYQGADAATLSTDVQTLAGALAADAATLDQSSGLASPRDYAAQQAQEIASQRTEIQNSRTQVNEGRGQRAWTEIAQEMVTLINSGVKKATSGDGQGGARDVNEAYYGYYEKLGFERTVMAAISGDRVSQVENQFKTVRKVMISEAEDTEIKAEAALLTSYLLEDAAALDAGAADGVNPVTAFFTGSFGQAFLILVREGLEAILVVAAVIAYLIKAGLKDRVRYIYAGVLLGLAASGVVAVLFSVLYSSASSHQEVLEGVVALVAMAMLLFTSNWMLSKSSVESWNRYIKDATEVSVSRGGLWALASLSFLAVFREGAETVLFYQALFAIDPSGAASIWQGFAAAAVVLVGIFLLIRFTSVRIPLRPFFAVTSALMAALVVVFAGGAAHALLEGDVIPATYVPGVPTYDVLGLYPYRETLGFQAVMLVVVVALTVVSVLRRRRETAPAAQAPDEESSGDSSQTTDSTTTK